MYRYLATAAILLLTLSACGKDEPTKIENRALLSQAIATRPIVEQPAPTAPITAVAPAVTEVVEVEEIAANCAEVQPEVTPAPSNDCNYLTLTKLDLDEPTTGIITIGMQNKFGEIILPHQLHVEMYNCSTCHATNPPGKINKTKKEFHDLCRKCHTQLKQGPIKCRSCHLR
jgi:hypothetical protein